MSELSDADLAAIEARANAATRGPWEWTHGMDSRWEVFGPDGLKVRGSGYTDAEFIAYARSDVPALLAALAAERQRADEAEARIAQVESAIRAMRGVFGASS